MGKQRRRPAQCLIEQDVARGAGEPLFGPQDVGYFHQVVVCHVGEMVGGVAVRFQEDKIIEEGVSKGDVVTDEIMESRFAGFGNLEAHNLGVAVGRLRRPDLCIEVAAAAVVAWRLAGGALRLAHGVQALRGAVADVGVATVHKLAGVAFVQARLFAPRLEVGAERATLALATGLRPFVPINAQPRQRLQDRLDGPLHLARLVGIFNPDDERSAHVPGKKPVEQCGADVAYMRDARGAGRVANADCGGHAAPVAR